MSHFIITVIIALAAAKAKAQVKYSLTKQNRSEKSELKRRVANKWAGYEIKSDLYKRVG